MQYHPDDFIKLTDRIEQEGGYVQPDPCLGDEYRLKVPGPTGRREWRRFRTSHCDLHARVAVSYDPTIPVNLKLAVYADDGEPTGDFIEIKHKGEKDDGAHFAAVCAVDDSVGRWPRYRGVVSDESYMNP